MNSTSLIEVIGNYEAVCRTMRPDRPKGTSDLGATLTYPSDGAKTLDFQNLSEVVERGAFCAPARLGRTNAKAFYYGHWVGQGAGGPAGNTSEAELLRVCGRAEPAPLEGRQPKGRPPCEEGSGDDVTRSFLGDIVLELRLRRYLSVGKHGK